MKKLAIITGGSRGLGLALLKTYQQADYETVNISRTPAPICCRQLEVDLSSPEEIEGICTPFFLQLNANYKEIVLINNAGTLGDVGPLSQNSPKSIQNTINLNATAPLLLSSLLLSSPTTQQATKHIINISSGAAHRPYSGWTTYCSSKAALHMSTQTMALEHQNQKNIRFLSIDPGVMDTEMQAQIRKVKATDFPKLERFLALKEERLLRDPKQVAQFILATQQDSKHPSGTEIDIDN